MGSVYRQQLSPFWWIKYSVDGRIYRESTKTADRKAAQRTLKIKEGRAALGEPVRPRLERVRYDELAADLTAHYRTTGRRRLVEVEDSLAHLTPFFAGRRAVHIIPALITEYVAARQATKTKHGRPPANRTINLELSILKRMLRLAYEHDKLFRVPVIRMLKEAPPRAGFFERDQHRAVRARLGPDLQGAVAIAFTYGWRVKEILRLERRQIDLEAGTIRLDPGRQKNEDGRLVFLTPDVARLLGEQLDRIRTLERTTGRIIPYVFPHLSGRRAGEPRRDFRRSWRTACAQAGVPGMLRHDYRRTAVRNLVNAGVPERVAMAVTGHRTRSVFDRYHIVSPADLQAATRRLAEADGHNPGHNRQAGLDVAARK